MLDDILKAVHRIDPDGVHEFTVTVTVEVRGGSLKQCQTPTEATEAAPTVIVASGLTGSRRAVVEAVAAGATRPKEIEDVTGLKHRRIAELLKELVETGHLIQFRYGRYQAAA